MKRIAIVIKGLPFDTIRNSEGLRCAVGLTLEEENKVSIFFINDGVLTAASLDCPAAKSLDLDKHIETLKMMDVELIAEEEALTEHRIQSTEHRIIVRPREEILKAIKDSDVVMVF